jgi:hypothetical protein
MVEKCRRDGLLVKIDNLIDDAKCFDTVRTIRWANTICCSGCGSTQAIRY